MPLPCYASLVPSPRETYEPGVGWFEINADLSGSIVSVAPESAGSRLEDSAVVAMEDSVEDT